VTEEPVGFHRESPRVVLGNCKVAGIQADQIFNISDSVVPGIRVGSIRRRNALHFL
jgi:hypothetical protein